MEPVKRLRDFTKTSPETEGEGAPVSARDDARIYREIFSEGDESDTKFGGGTPRRRAGLATRARTNGRGWK